ncbi:MAG: hypothetical protein LBK00_10720, partial [Treponema sp.]|nr:hypothetical protein [Treponema sp.]
MVSRLNNGVRGDGARGGGIAVDSGVVAVVPWLNSGVEAAVVSEAVVSRPTAVSRRGARGSGV